ncbi:MAG: PIG-L deacetylase family protein [Candidatus Cloacimonadaceae bacterium]|nr:PIG-L deacetylase family protein [Candidatus Cloacimonadaceae bacterium]
MSFVNKMRRVLILAPHTDDGEFGCGASIAKLTENGCEVFYGAFSIAEESVPHCFPSNILETEVREATKILGIQPDNLILFKYKVRNFAIERQSILDDLVLLNKDISPDLVFMPSLNDLHQDHQTIAAEGLRAFKKTTILCYELPWNNVVFSNNCFISFNENHLATKVKALDCYKSQKHRNYASEEFIRSLAITRGTQIGTNYAEVFEVIRWVIN